MKRFLLLIVSALFAFLSVWAQNDGKKNKKLPTDRRIRTFIIKNETGIVDSVGFDTLLNGYNISNPAFKRTIGLQYLGNYGSPAQSMIFSDRKERSKFLFFKPFEHYYFASEDIVFFNTKVPYTFLNYYNGGPSNRKERRINGVFTVNVNPRLNFGMYGDWISGYGEYASQSTRGHNTGFFGSYMGHRNSIMGSVSFNGFENYENGGLTDMDYVRRPNSTGDIESQNMPVYITDNAWSKVKNWNAALNYKFHLFGVERTIQVTEDSSSTAFIPATSLFYDFKNEVDFKKYYERNASGCDSFYYKHNFDISKNIDSIQTMDSTRFWRMKHTAGLTLNEEFNSLMRFGLSAFITADMKRYTVQTASDYTQYTNEDGRYCELSYDDVYRYKYGIGARLSKHLGKKFTYDIFGEYYFFDEKESQKSFSLSGQIGSKISILGQEVDFGAKAQLENEAPDYLEENYFSNRISWSDLNFNHKQRRTLFAFLAFPKMSFYEDLGLTLKVGMTNLENYIYFNKDAMPAQYDRNIEVFDFTLKENFRVWYFHLDNEITIQKCSDDHIISLPDFVSYSKAYFQFNNLFKVLSLQVGMDMRYNTEYYAPSYMPATGMFYNQRHEKFGNCPVMDAFLNCHLKRACFFLAYNHISQGWFNNNYITCDGYALNTSYLKLGVSANLSY